MRLALALPIVCALAGCRPSETTAPDESGFDDGAAAADVAPDTADVSDAASDASDATIAQSDAACGAAPALFWTEGHVVRGAALDGACPMIVATGVFPTGVTVDPSSGKLYWADNGTDSIARADYDGGALETLYASPDAFANPEGVAVDPHVDRLFWTELGTGTVRSASLDGGETSTLFRAVFPTGIAVDPSAGLAYFADNGTDQVEVIPYAGGDAATLYSAPSVMANPTAVAVDPAHGIVFWCQAGGVWRMQLDGGAAAQIATVAFPQGVAVDPSAERIYVTDNGTDTITCMTLDGGAAQIVYRSADRFSNPHGIALVPSP